MAHLDHQGFVGGQSQNSGRAPGLQHAKFESQAVQGQSTSRGWIRMKEAYDVRRRNPLQGVGRSKQIMSVIDLEIGSVGV